jgi:DNA primase
MTFWCAGFRNVTAAYGTNGLTEDHIAAFRAYGVARVLIAFDRDEAGERGAAEVAERLMKEGIACFRNTFPKGMDANDYALKVTPAARSLGVLIRKAEWLGQGKRPEPTSARAELETALAVPVTPVEEPSPLAADPIVADAVPEPVSASPLPAAAPVDTAQVAGEELVMVLGDRRYRVRGWRKPQSPEALKVNLLVHRPADPESRFHVDTLDLYAAKARAGFARVAGIELGESEDVLRHDLGRVLLKLEQMQDAELATALSVDDKPAMSAAERADAIALLKART